MYRSRKQEPQGFPGLFRHKLKKENLPFPNMYLQFCRESSKEGYRAVPSAVYEYNLIAASSA